MKKPCSECKKEFDEEDLVHCVLLDDDHTDPATGEWLCDTCIQNSGYCRSCGQFCAGMTRFDFGPMAGFCDNCEDQIRTDAGEFYEEEDDDYFYLESPDP